MGQTLEQTIIQFFANHLNRQVPLLLALSGGVDSMVLFAVVQEYRQRFPFPLAIVHVDHGWRPESGEEAQFLRRLATEADLLFFERRLVPDQLQGNLEDACRQERLAFFQEVAQETQAQAILLAHHADDQAETVLKRLFESGTLIRLEGLKSIAHYGNLPLWRPFLAHKKKEISAWAESKDLFYFVDSSNLDNKFLRARCRSQLLPYLEKTFDKGLIGTLCHLAREAQELKEYLSEKTEVVLLQSVSGKMGRYLDFSTQESLKPLELKYILRILLERERITLHRDVLDTCVHSLLNGAANKTFAEGRIEVDRRRLFLPCLRLYPFLYQQISCTGSFFYGPWIVTVREEEEPLRLATDWQALWVESGCLAVPVGEYTIGPPVMQARYPTNSSLADWWTTHKIPAFLRCYVPILWKGNKAAYEFLTGKIIASEPSLREKRWLVELKYTL